MSDGVAFHCPEVTNGIRTYHEGEIETSARPELVVVEDVVQDVPQTQPESEIVDAELVEPESAPEPEPAKSSQPTATRPEGAGGRTVDETERQMLWDLAAAVKLTAGQFANVLKVANDQEPVEWKGSPAAADRFIDRELTQLRAARIDRVRAGIAHAAAEGSQAS
jgi:hypothetical protein